MKSATATLTAVVLVLFIPIGARGETNSTAKTDLDWVAFPDSTKFKVLGLYWFDQNSPKLWRMPAQEMSSLPKGVQGRSKWPSGARIVMRCNTSRLAMQAAPTNGGSLNKFDVYINGRRYTESPDKEADNKTIRVLFQHLDDREKEITIYLPHLQEIVIKAIGVDPHTTFCTPDHRYARPLPVVFYGSSVCQGNGAINPGQTYEAVLGRDLNLDFVNLGFGGAGKAETNVIALVNSVPACCYVFDLGKSYGAQEATAFKAMLSTIRHGHPDVPIVVITPITSAKEVKEPSYSERSIHTRKVMRDAAKALIESGDKRIVLVEGEDLFGFSEHNALSKDGVHPSDQGYRVIAVKLSPLLSKVLGF